MVRSHIVAIANYCVVRRIQLYYLPTYVRFDWSLYTAVRALALLSSHDRVQDAGLDRYCSSER